VSFLFRGRAGREELGASAQLTGTALVDAVAGIAAGDTPHARGVAFAVAQAARGGDDNALRALDALLDQAPPIAARDEGTLVNVLSALQFASMLTDDARADWVPARHAIARTVELGLRSGEALREQTEGLLWALVDRRLAADWLGHDVADVIASGDVSSELREQIASQARTHEHGISLVADGDLYPLALAGAASEMPAQSAGAAARDRPDDRRHQD
jgi:hypothetical protein